MHVLGGSLVKLIFLSKINDGAIFRQNYRQSIISRFSTRKLYVLGLNQKKIASLYTYTPYPSQYPTVEANGQSSLKQDRLKLQIDRLLG